MKIALALLAALTLAACGGGGDGGDGDNGGDPVVETDAFNLDETNAEDAAAICVRAGELFPWISAKAVGMVEAVLASGVQTGGSIDLGNIELCDAGRTDLVWNDADSDAGISPGDTLTLTLVACGEGGATHDGTLTITFTAGGAMDAEADVVLDLVTNRAPDVRIAQTGSFEFAYSTLDSVGYEFGFGGMADPGALLTYRRGTSAGSLPVDFLFGCFSVRIVGWSTSAPRRFEFELGGVAESADHGALTFGTTVRLEVEPVLGDSLPDDGTVGFSSLGRCAAAGLPDGVEDSDGSTMRLNTLGSGQLRLDGMDGWGIPFSVIASWADLR